MTHPSQADANLIHIHSGGADLTGTMEIPENAKGVVLFAHGSGSSRHSPRNRFVAGVLQQRGFGTILFDLLTEVEEQDDAKSGHLRFDISLLADRLVVAIDWLRQQPQCAGLAIGLFGASTGAGAALLAAVQRPAAVRAIVSRGGRPDLAGEDLAKVTAPTLLLVGEQDIPVIALNEDALALLGSREKQLLLIPGATHLFEEPDTLEQVARRAGAWFDRYLPEEPKDPNPLPPKG
jgi:dienelactone hydrolase